MLKHAHAFNGLELHFAYLASIVLLSVMNIGMMRSVFVIGQLFSKLRRQSMQESVHVYTLGIQRTSFISTQEKLFIINMYLSALPKDLHNELAYRLRGRALLDYCKRYPRNQPDFWKDKLFYDYGATLEDDDHETPITINDYLAYVIAEELDIPRTSHIEHMDDELLVPASRGVPQAIDYFILYAEDPHSFFATGSPATYNYIWDTYPPLRIPLLLTALTDDIKLIHPPREMDVPMRTIVEWIVQGSEGAFGRLTDAILEYRATRQR